MSRCCSLLLHTGAGCLCGESVVLATSLESAALDFPLGESILEPSALLGSGLWEHISLVESGSGAGRAMVLAGGAKAMALCEMGTVAEVTHKPLTTHVGMS